MSDAGLWPSLDLETRTPLELLQEQAEALGARTAGHLKGHIEGTEDDGSVKLEFVVEAPSLDYRHILFRVEHGAELSFPAVVIAEPVAKVVKEEEEDTFLGDRVVEEEIVHEGARSVFGFTRGPTTTRIKRYRKRVTYPNAHSEEEFLSYLRKILQAPSTTAVLNSLLARIRARGSERSSEAD